MLKESLITALNQAGFTAAAGRPWTMAGVLKQEKVCVTVKKMSLRPGAAARYLGCDADGEEVYGMAMELTLALYPMSPRQAGAEGCEDLCQEIMEQLLMGIPGFQAESADCGEVKFDEMRDCYYGEITVQTRVLASTVADDPGSTLSGFKIRGVANP